MIEPKKDNIISLPIETFAADYFDKNNKVILENEAKSRIIFIMTLLVLLLVTITFACLLYIYRRNNRLKEERIWQLKKDLERLQNEASNDSQTDFYETLTNSLDNLEVLGSQFFNCPSTSHHYQSSSIKKVIDSFSNEFMLQKLEKIIDKKHNGLVKEIKTHYPKLSHKQKLLLYYSILGFSSEAICAIVSVTEMNALYALRSRLRKTLAGAQPPSYNMLISSLAKAK